MRGKGETATREFLDIGITPAYAGKSRGFDRFVCVTEDHPRLCGETTFFESSAVELEGSPPPMRGKGRFFLVFLTCVGITPAYAGKSAMLCKVAPET